MKRLVAFNLLALVGYFALLFFVSSRPSKPLDALANPHPGLYAAVIIGSMFLSSYIVSFLALRRRFGDFRRRAAVSIIPACCSVALSAFVIYLVIAMNLVSVN